MTTPQSEAQAAVMELRDRLFPHFDVVLIDPFQRLELNSGKMREGVTITLLRPEQEA